MENTTEWEERLRELYLTKVPDENGYLTRSITFLWGTFTCALTEPMEFYLTTKGAMEDFIRKELSAKDAEIERAIEEVIRDLYTETQSIRDANNLTREEKFDQESGILKGIAKLKFKYLNSEKKE